MLTHILNAIGEGYAVEVPYSGLTVKTNGCREGYGYVEVGNRNTQDERMFIQAFFGTQEPGEGRRVYVLTEKAVKSALRSNANGVVARACYFNHNQDFGAFDWLILSALSAVRGVRRPVAIKDDAA